MQLVLASSLRAQSKCPSISCPRPQTQAQQRRPQPKAWSNVRGAQWGKGAFGGSWAEVLGSWDSSLGRHMRQVTGSRTGRDKRPAVLWCRLPHPAAAEGLAGPCSGLSPGSVGSMCPDKPRQMSRSGSCHPKAGQEHNRRRQVAKGIRPSTGRSLNDSHR